VASPFSVLGYFDPSGKGLVSSLQVLHTYARWTGLIGWVVWSLGIVGGLLAPRDVPRRLLLGGITAGGSAALFFLHAPAVLGQVPGSWGFVVLPTVVACTPLAFAKIFALSAAAGRSGNR